MSSDQKVTQLDSIAQINPVRKVVKGSYVPFIDMAALSQNLRDINKNSIDQRIAKGAGAHFKNFDTLLARITPCLENGKTAQVKCLADNIVGEGSSEFIVLCGLESADNDYIYYLCRDPEFRKFAIKQMEGTSGRQRVSWQSIAAYKFLCPVPEIRRSNVKILSMLDDRITTLRETNIILEAIAQALFKSWFIDFDPVRAKQSGKQPEGMDEATATLFPNSFEQSELGEIPKGWRSGKIGDISTAKGGFAFKGDSFFDSGFPVIKIKNILGDGTVNLKNVQYIKSNIADKNKKFSLNDGDIVIAMTGATIGKTGIIIKDELTPYLNQRVAKFDEKLDCGDNRWFIYTAFQNKNISEQVFNIAHGSAQPNISTSGIESIRLTIPQDLIILNTFNTFVSSLFKRWVLNHKQIITLSKISDALLPRLISGQLRLPDAEEVMNNKTKVAS